MDKCCIDTMKKLNQTNQKLAVIGGFLAAEPFITNIGQPPKEIAKDLLKEEVLGRLAMDDATKRLKDSGIASQIKGTLSDMQSIQKNTITKIVFEHVTLRHPPHLESAATKFWRRYLEVTVGFSQF